MAFLNSLTNLVQKTLARKYGQDTSTSTTGGGSSWYEPKKESNLFSVSRPQNLSTSGFQVNNANPNMAGMSLNKTTAPVYGPAVPNPRTPSPSIQQIKAPAITQAQASLQPPAQATFMGQQANQAQLNALSQAASPKPQAPVDMSGFYSTDIGTQNRIAEMQAQALANSTMAGSGTVGGDIPKVEPYGLAAGQGTPPQQPVGLSDLEKAYLASFDMTPEERAQQARLNDIIAQQANLAASEQLGLNKIKDQAIAMPFVTGQSASLQRSVAGQMGALEAQGTPLVNQLAMAQANRQSMADRAKAELEIIKNQQAALKPTTTEVGGTLIQYNPATGQYTEVYRAPGEAAKPIALGEGQILVDPITGERIASGLPKTTTAEFGKTQIINGEMYQQDPITGAWSKVDLGNAPSAAKIETAQSVVALAQSILNDNKFNAVFGPISSRIPTLSGETATLEANIERLKSLLTIENVGIMKGVLSDSDMRVLSSAAAALNTGMGEAGARKEIQRIITDMQDRISKAGQSGGGNSDPLGLGFNSASGQALNSPASSLNVPPENKTVNTAMGSAIITGYGSKYWKPGLDIVFPGSKTALVKPPSDYTVVDIKTGYNGGFGNQVKVRDTQGNEMWFSHLDVIGGVQKGGTYKAGTPVGIQGNTGKTYGATGIHVDITMPKPGGGYYDAKQVAAYLNAR